MLSLLLGEHHGCFVKVKNELPNETFIVFFLWNLISIQSLEPSKLVTSFDIKSGWKKKVNQLVTSPILANYSRCFLSIDLFSGTKMCLLIVLFELPSQIFYSMHSNFSRKNKKWCLHMMMSYQGVFAENYLHQRGVYDVMM